MPPGDPILVKGSGLQKKCRQTLDGLLFCAYNISGSDTSLNDAGRVGSFTDLLPLPIDRAELRRHSIKANSSTVSFTLEQEVSAEASFSRIVTVNGAPTLVVNGELTPFYAYSRPDSNSRTRDYEPSMKKSGIRLHVVRQGCLGKPDYDYIQFADEYPGRPYCGGTQLTLCSCEHSSCTILKNGFFTCERCKRQGQIGTYTGEAITAGTDI